jgi:Lon-like ATP-dependent protease
MQNIKDGIEGHPVSWYSQVFDILFSDLDHDGARQIWQKSLAKPEGKKGEHEGDE